MLSTIKWRDFPDFLSVMFEEMTDEKLWSMYIANPMRQNVSYNEFKEQMLEKSKPKEQVESESQKAAESALRMLEKFGGDDFGI